MGFGVGFFPPEENGEQLQPNAEAVGALEGVWEHRRAAGQPPPLPGGASPEDLRKLFRLPDPRPAVHGAAFRLVSPVACPFAPSPPPQTTTLPQYLLRGAEETVHPGQLGGEGDVLPERVQRRPGGLGEVGAVERVGVIQQLYPAHQRGHGASIHRRRRARAGGRRSGHTPLPAPRRPSLPAALLCLALPCPPAPSHRRWGAALPAAALTGLPEPPSSAGYASQPPRLGEAAHGPLPRRDLLSAGALQAAERGQSGSTGGGGSSSSPMPGRCAPSGQRDCRWPARAAGQRAAGAPPRPPAMAPPTAGNLLPGLRRGGGREGESGRDPPAEGGEKARGEPQPLSLRLEEREGVRFALRAEGPSPQGGVAVAGRAGTPSRQDPSVREGLPWRRRGQPLTGAGRRQCACKGARPCCRKQPKCLKSVAWCLAGSEKKEALNNTC